ncbi:S8 family peptidase [Kutzneria kofuensis]|uniref:Subtilisin family serine protease n=1 Tax=Kutzneria kofuensis TaxID=103725 RepID=A0A7W9KIY9_9PSEU|nr:S8 family serine peptidase [Kutzneria kofuensis]MBB5893415.1 subtilisin family serine protease [Kutzneria kofuensis]
MRRLLTLLTAAGAALVGLAPVASAAPEHHCDATGTTYTYVVLYTPGVPRFVADAELRLDCGSLVEYYPEIGVAVATSASPDFADRLGPYRAYSGRKDVPTSTLRSRSQESALAAVPAADRSAEQWDMDLIKAKQANKVNEGSRRVVVGVLDSGVDATHPEFAKAIDPADSAGCLTGKADPSPDAWKPTTSSHGTHVAGTIAAADDGNGVTGIAPNVRLAAVKVVSDDGFIFPEAAVCGFVWAGKHHFAVTNNSYFVDPGFYFCRNKPGDAVAYEAIRRAVAYATGRGVLTVAAAGNEAMDIANPTKDTVRAHPVDRNCATLPAGLPDVVSVTAVGYAGTKSSYSDWGKVDVTAPGGDGRQVPPAGSGPACPLSTLPGGAYGSMCGTSMASPHVVGVVALLASTHPWASPAQLRGLLRAEATPIACPAATPTCTGPAGDNTYYGHGLVDALAAVTR